MSILEGEVLAAPKKIAKPKVVSGTPVKTSPKKMMSETQSPKSPSIAGSVISSINAEESSSDEEEVDILLYVFFTSATNKQKTIFF